MWSLEIIVYERPGYIDSTDQSPITMRSCMKDKTKIMVIEGDLTVRNAIGDSLAAEGYEVVKAETGKTGMKLFSDIRADILIADIELPDMNGVQILREARELYPETKVIFMSTNGSADFAAIAMQEGACDCLAMPFSMNKLLLVIKRVIRMRLLEEENVSLRKRIEEQHGLGELVGKSPQILEIYDLIETVSQTDATVLIRGESGTGKELVANAIHLLSQRKDAPFIKVNCAALPETLLETELFGHEKGAFTGAIKLRKGRFELADGGTLFLDEIGDLPLSVQVKLLRVLQERRFERVGGNETIFVDVRLICATLKNLKEEIRRGAFREDLYYRLNVVPINLPPLKERREDILLLADYFVKKISKKMGKKVKGISEEAKRLLMKYSFPGNIRELENIMERAIALLKGDVIKAEDFPDEVREHTSAQAAVCQKIMELKQLGEAVSIFEKEYIQNVLKATKGKKGQAAEILGISRKNLWEKIKGLEIEI
jgi:DNA-binding NtrC family response regulator